jgi:hypothetical protein
MNLLLKISLFAVLFSYYSLSICKAQKEFNIKQLFTYKALPYDHIEYIGHDSDNVYYGRYFEKSRKLEFYSNNIHSGLLQNSTTTKLPSQYAASRIFKFSITNGNLCILSIFYNSQHEKHYIFRETFNTITLKTNNDVTKVAEIPAMNKDFAWFFRSSQNKKVHTLIIYNFKGKESLGSFIYVFDEYFNLLYQKNNILDQFYGYVSIGEIIVSEDNKVFIFAKGFANNNEAKQTQKVKITLYKEKIPVMVNVNEQNYTYFMICIEEDNDVQLHKFIPPKGKFIKYATVFNIHNESFFSGVYSDKGNLNSAGVFLYKFHENLPKHIEISDYFTFTDELQSQYLSEHDMNIYERARSVSKTELWDYHDHSNIGLTPFHDGYLLFIEKTLKIHVTSSPSFDVLCNDYIYAVYVNGKENYIQTLVKIPKKTVYTKSTIRDPYTQCSYRVVNGKLYIVFGDTKYGSIKAENFIIYVYDEELIRKTFIIPMKDIYKFGFTTNNIWLSDTSFLANGYETNTKKEQLIIHLNISELSD